MSDAFRHGDWLSLIDVSGPFLAEPVLKDAFPQGLSGVDGERRRVLRSAYEEWREAVDLKDAELPALHNAWVQLVLTRLLDWDASVLRTADGVPGALCSARPEYGIVLRPDYALVSAGEEATPMCLVMTYGADRDLGVPIKGDGWAASAAERMVELCRGAGARLGIVTNGEAWMLVDAPVGGVTSFATWYARMWLQEPTSFQAFVDLLGLRRFFVEENKRLPALLDRSLEHQEEVTDALGEQVRRAIEVLIQSLDRADLDRERALLQGIAPREVYEAALTVMMRIVFLLSAEERGLLLMGDARYEAGYAVSTLRGQLRALSDEILERRFDAWSRLLAIFRVVYAGVDHEGMRLPALGGSLFDPDRYPFLEGRAPGTSWTTTQSAPLPIDNRTVLLILDAVQLFQGRTLSYRALDVEQIGHVYEGLLERTVARARAVTLDLSATKGAKNPWVTLPELEAAAAIGRETLEALLKERTGSSPGRITKGLDKAVDASSSEKLLTACQGDIELRDRLRPYFHFLRMDRWSYPLVYPEGAYMVASGSDRREAGAHYTPKSLTEGVVRETLEPLVYAGPAEGEPKGRWRLRPPAELLALKICDPAMGSGAFLVQVCRYMGERLVEAWDRAEGEGKAVTAAGDVVDTLGAAEPMRKDFDERLVLASRMVAERCIYGVDMNPLAVELAKLSIWIVTLAKGRPFGFLDHNLRCGDSLLGVTSIDQLRFLEFKPTNQSTRKLFSRDIDKAVDEALQLRIRMRSEPVIDIRDIQAMARLDGEARAAIASVELAADALMAEVIASDGGALDAASLSIDVGAMLAGDERKTSALRQFARQGLDKDLPSDKASRRPLHWPLAFPEVFAPARGGFDAFVGNPPFVGGQMLSGSMGSAYHRYLCDRLTYAEPASVDLVVYFFLRVFPLLRPRGTIGLLARRSFAEGKNREVGLTSLMRAGATIYLANTNIVWPGAASVIVHQVHLTSGDQAPVARLNGDVVTGISSDLTSGQSAWSLRKLSENLGRAFQGPVLGGEGFKVSSDIAVAWLQDDPRFEAVLFPFIGGNEVNKDARARPACFVINFWDWSEDEAKQFPRAFGKIESEVRSERLKKGKGANERWWQHYRSGTDLYHALGRGAHFRKHPDGWASDRNLSRFLVISTGVTKYPAFTFLPSTYICSNKLCIVADDRAAMFAALTSDIHGVWAWKQKTSLADNISSLVYAHGNIFETFPFPETLLAEGDGTLETLGEQFFASRQTFMVFEGAGLTKFYNAFHQRTVRTPEMDTLRDQQRAINEAVLDLYGWDDLSLDMDFHEVGYLPAGSNVRFTVSEETRAELLSRLAKLNGERMAADEDAESEADDPDDDDDDGGDLLSVLKRGERR